VLINGRHYLATQLQEPLVGGIGYYAEFHVSMADSLWYATRNLGIHFSATEYTQDVNDLLALTPQVSYQGAEFLDDKIGWTRIAGHFTAQGGERYLAIGNFDTDAETDTLFVPGGGTEAVQSEGYWEESAYFVDDVLLVPDSIYLGNEELEIKNDELLLYPNPAKAELTIETETFSDRMAELFELSGRMVLQQPL
jgi:hypothetical protein